jgi:hypothetical protein
VQRSFQAAALGLLLGACSEPPEPQRAPVSKPTPDAGAGSADAALRPEPVARNAGQDELEDWPEPRLEPASWAFLPTVDPTLREALATGERAEVLLDALVRTLAPYRWAGVDDWDNLGFIRTEDDAPRGFVTRVDGALRMQPEGSYSLGCAGGFLEGLRVALVPELGMAQLQRCEEATLAVLGPGAPSTCRPEDFGLHAIANAARAAEAAGVLAAPVVPVRIEPVDPAALAPLMAPGVLQLCTVSHEPTVGASTRLHHHLMIVLRATGPRAMMLFDTTGYRGVALRRIDAKGLSRYITTALARNDTHHYDPASARVDCLTLARRP